MGGRMTPLQRLQTLAALVQFHELPTIYTLTIESNGLAVLLAATLST
jgi:hypothetical protein